MSDSLDHVTVTRVRYGETDKMGIVYHANYVVYFELGRTELMRARGLAYSALERLGCRLVVTEVQCRYRANAAYDEELTIRTRVSEVRHASIRFDYRVEGAGRLLAEGYTELASVDAAGKPTRLPKELGSLARP